MRALGMSPRMRRRMAQVGRPAGVWAGLLGATGPQAGIPGAAAPTTEVFTVAALTPGNRPEASWTDVNASSARADPLVELLLGLSLAALEETFGLRFLAHPQVGYYPVFQPPLSPAPQAAAPPPAGPPMQQRSARPPAPASPTAPPPPQRLPLPQTSPAHAAERSAVTSVWRDLGDLNLDLEPLARSSYDERQPPRPKPSPPSPQAAGHLPDRTLAALAPDPRATSVSHHGRGGKCSLEGRAPRKPSTALLPPGMSDADGVDGAEASQMV